MCIYASVLGDPGGCVTVGEKSGDARNMGEKKSKGKIGFVHKTQHLLCVRCEFELIYKMYGEAIARLSFKGETLTTRVWQKVT